MFIIFVKYIKPLDQVDPWVAAHRAFLKEYYKRAELVCSGAQNPRTGGIIVANMSHAKRVWEMIEQDPFFMQGVAEYEVVEFLPSLYDERFSCFVENQVV